MTTDPDPVVVDERDTESVPKPNRQMRTATPIAAVSLVLLAASAVLFTLPVSNPGVQNCGAPAWYLLQATSDAPLITADGKPINGWDKARVLEADDHRCSKLVADRAVPAGILLAGFWLFALVAVILMFSGRRSLRRHLADDASAEDD